MVFSYTFSVKVWKVSFLFQALLVVITQGNSSHEVRFLRGHFKEGQLLEFPPLTTSNFNFFETNSDLKYIFLISKFVEFNKFEI